MLCLLTLLQISTASIDGIESDFAVSIILGNWMSGCASSAGRIAESAKKRGVNPDRTLATSLSSEYVRRLIFRITDFAIKSDTTTDTAFPLALSESLRATNECWALTSLLWRDILEEELARPRDMRRKGQIFTDLLAEDVRSMQFAGRRLAADISAWYNRDHEIFISLKILELAGQRLLLHGEFADAVECHLRARERFLVSMNSELPALIRIVHVKFLQRFTLGKIPKFFSNVVNVQSLLVLIFSLIALTGARSYLALDRKPL